MNEFKVETIELAGKNLVEASAGTGKTYSVSLLALRLILEKDISADKILMVTFTEAAAAEMAERMRRFIKQAYEAALGKNVDETIKKIVDKTPNCLEKLRRAYMLLDEINVFTIHGFCNKILRELAFETDSNFDFNIIADDKAIFQEVFDNYWREELILNETARYKDHLDKTFLLFFNKDEKQINKKITADELPYFKEIKTSIADKIKAYKKRYNYFTYDDLIQNLYEASVHTSKASILRGILAQKYEAVFIDEFQDTDKNQFYIFSNLFPDKVHFYVGDPKQCIYTFRGADIDNYISIRNDENIIKYNMGRNFRSSPELVDALNDFYLKQKNPFNNDKIQYNIVAPVKKEFFIKDDKQKLKSFSIFYKIKDIKSISEYTINRIVYYLTKCEFSDGTAIKPSDIAVLFRTNGRISEIREELINIGIPSVEIKSNSIFHSNEANFIQNALKLLLNPGREEFIQFLTDRYIGFSPLEISEIDISEELQKIKEVKSGLDKNGIYYSLSKLIGFYHNEAKIKALFSLSYNRMKSNVLQLLDILHAKIEKEKISYDLLLKFITREKQSESDKEKDESLGSNHYEQQLESDENAVKLMTIHKSKGLEFPIVIFPAYATKFNEDDTYRVLYVTLTRAKYKTDIICYTDGRSSNSKLVTLLRNLKNEHKTYQNFDDYRFEEHFEMIKQSETITQPVSPVPSIIDKSWKVSSYSALATHSDYLPKYSEKTQEDDYERFVFESMPKGKLAGIFLHSLFENADFSSENFSDFLKTQNSNYLVKKGEKANIGDYALLIENVLGADYSGFNLVGLDNSKRINEFEYHIKIKDDTKIKAITNILEKGAELGEAKISGLLKGFIDMVFEKNGKYYIIDWKSNFLGDSLDAYDQESMQAAIKAANYDLQYHLYAVALCSFLKSRVKDFSYEKHFGGGFWVFLRGCRKGNNNGICHQPPNFEVHSRLFDILGNGN